MLDDRMIRVLHIAEGGPTTSSREDLLALIKYLATEIRSRK